MKKYWLVKSEPVKYSFDTFMRDKKTMWDGVRNYQARNHLRSMQVNDEVLFYHSNEGKAIVGLAQVLKTAYPDPTAKEGDWSVVDLGVVKPFVKDVTLEQIKNHSKLQDLALVKQSRLSVMPVSDRHFKILLQMGEIL